MLELFTSSAWSEAMAQALSYRGPERRHSSELGARMLSLVLDEIDYGMVLLSEHLRVLHVNHAAQAEMTAQHPLQLAGREVHTAQMEDADLLSEALQSAANRGLRRLISLGQPGQRVSISVVPLPRGSNQHMVLLVLGRPQVGGVLAVQGYARAHNLSPGEEQVLRSLCQGMSPQKIALEHGVKIATVRTQIAHLRTKTGAPSIRDLVHQVALLPPMVGVLQRQGRTTQ